MIMLDSKFFEHLVGCLEKQRDIHLQPYKTRVDWQQRINITVEQCKGILRDALEDERKQARKHALFLIPDNTLFDTEHMEEQDD